MSRDDLPKPLIHHAREDERRTRLQSFAFEFPHREINENRLCERHPRQPFFAHEVALKEYDASVFFHLGDSECESEEINPFCSVKGNCDSSLFHYPLARTFILPSGKKIFLRHHPYRSLKEYQSLEKDGFSYFIHGHTHKRREEQIDSLFVYCPGSLDYPRDGHYGSYLVLEANENEEAFQFRSI